MATSPSKIRDFVAFLASIKGDLSNITAPPFFLAPQSILEVGKCWTERPSLLSAPAAEVDLQKRAYLILKWFLGSLNSFFYVGQEHPGTGIRKPLNAFLGEVFFGEWCDGNATSRIVTEQASHHPPITACYLWDEENGIRGDGYTRTGMTFLGSINIEQIGNAMLHIDRYSEDHLIPFPSVKVKGFLAGCLYPELDGTYHIISSSGFVSEIKFTGSGFFSGSRNGFTAKLYRRDDVKKEALYMASGTWNDSYTFYDGASNESIETWEASSHPASPIQQSDISDQDPWESRQAWKNIISGLKKADMQQTIQEKPKLEQAQRDMRKRDAADGAEWEPLFFSQMEEGV